MKRKRDPFYELNHFQQRMRERYGMEIHLYDVVKINLAIVNGIDTCLLYEEDDDQWIYEVKFRDTWIQVVYSRRRETVTTALPPGTWSR